MVRIVKNGDRIQGFIFLDRIAFFSDTRPMSYPGGKGGSGVYQRIISMMPPHKLYIEAFLGSGVVVKNKKPAELSFGIELDDYLVCDWMRNNSFNLKNFRVQHANFIEWLNGYFLSIRNYKPSEILIYADPPYLQNVRKSKSKIYRCEFMTEAEHLNLLTQLKSLSCMVMISGYDSSLYNEMLSTWRKEIFNTTNRAGQKTTETVWLNFPEPLELHDYQFLGNNFRERERIKRKRERWKNRLLKMDSHEKFALLSTIEELKKHHETSL